MENLLQNPSFENGWHQTNPNSGNQTPNGWVLTWRDNGDSMLSAGAFPGEDAPAIDTVLAAPECVHKLANQLPPDEQLGAPHALILDGGAVYKVFRVGFSATLSQTLTLTPGARVRLTVPVQSHHHGDGSFGACAVRVGINDTAGQWATFSGGLPDPANPAWVTLTLEAVIPQSGICLVWIDFEGRAVAPVDFFVDAVSLTGVPTEPAVEPVDYVVTTELLPQDATLAEKLYVLTATHANKRTLTQSTGDAARLVAPGLPGSAVNVWAVQRQPAGIVQWLHAEGVETVNLFEFGETEPPAPLPDPDPDPDPTPTWTPRNYVSKGTKLGMFHCVGGYPADIAAQLSREGVTLSSVKFVQAIGDLNIATEHWTLGRIIDVPGMGSVEGFDYNGDPVAQAEARMAVLMHSFAPYRDKVDFIEIINEQAPPNDAAHVKLANFFLRAMQIAEANGFKLALFSHSVGTPENSAWTAIANTGVFEAAERGGHCISLHEYGDARYAPDSVLCRYRWLYQNIILPKRLNIPLFITEFNIWEQLIGQVDMLEHWIAYDRLARQDPYVAGIHVYSTGMAGPPYVPATVACLQRFAQYAIAEKNVVNG